MYTDRDLGFNRTGTVPIKASRERLSNGWETILHHDKVDTVNLELLNHNHPPIQITGPARC
jgi:hypothetical protein